MPESGFKRSFAPSDFCSPSPEEVVLQMLVFFFSLSHQILELISVRHFNGCYTPAPQRLVLTLPFEVPMFGLPIASLAVYLVYGRK